MNLMTVSSLTARLLLATTLVAATAFAADRPPPPQDVFRYVVFDAGELLGDVRRIVAAARAEQGQDEVKAP